MAQELTEELKVLITAEVDKAIKNLKTVDHKTSETEKLFKKLGNTIASAFTVKAIAGFAAESIQASQKAQTTLNILNQTILATGANAWTSSKELQQMSKDLQSMTNYADDEVQAMQAVLLGFKNIKGDNFREATAAILDMATVMGMDLKSAAQSIGKALDDPIKGMDSLKKQGFNFTDAQKEVIQAMLDTNDIAGAQKIVLDELAGTFGGAAQAAVNGATQIKNAWGDLKEGIGDFLTGFADSKSAQKIVSGITYVADAFARFHENVAFLRDTDTKGENAFSSYYNGLKDVEDKIKAAEVRTAAWRTKENELNKILESGVKLRKKEREEIEKGLANARERAEYWDAQADANYKNANLEIIIAQRKAEELAATSAIEELMSDIASSYEKLSSSDPLIQLEKYEKELKKIAQDKETLSLTTTGKDTTEALKQLEYSEKAIRAKMKEIRDKLQEDGKKSWKEYFAEITGVDSSSFSNGQEAAELYLAGMDDSLKNAQKLSELLGNKFDMKGYLEDQMSEIESILGKLLEIPADKIDEAFSTSDKSINALITKYRELKNEIESSDGNKLFSSWDEMLNTKMLSWVENMNLFKENVKASNETVAGLGVQLTNLAASASLDFMKSLGATFAEGDDAAENMAQALGEMSQKILDQLPLLFLQAGLNLIAQGQWALGLGLVAAGIGSGITSGFVSQKLSGDSTEANALGGVYGSAEYEAFAKGGTFTNSIVTQPTLFRFARGSGFGTGLMGEAGPEAIMPLERGPDGTLGVRSSGANANVMVVIKNYSGAEVQTSESTEGGQRRLEVMIGSAINSHISSGKADKAMSSRYGIKAQGV
ncbi:MAG: phage tail tape measure protein [Treponema sp.]|nr:phage tail tape measure protein [Candidatus Treponema caballi]